jgi:DNA transformation protein
MSETASDLAFAVELLSGIGRVEARRMFGGAGLYADGVMFGLIDDGVIFLKVDEPLKAALADAGSHPWVYTQSKGPKAGAPQETSHWSLPESALDDADEAGAWARRALAAAQAIKAAKPVQARKSRSGRAGAPAGKA